MVQTRGQTYHQEVLGVQTQAARLPPPIHLPGILDRVKRCIKGGTVPIPKTCAAPWGRLGEAFTEGFIQPTPLVNSRCSICRGALVKDECSPVAPASFPRTWSDPAPLVYGIDIRFNFMRRHIVHPLMSFANFSDKRLIRFLADIHCTNLIVFTVVSPEKRLIVPLNWCSFAFTGLSGLWPLS